MPFSRTQSKQTRQRTAAASSSNNSNKTSPIPSTSSLHPLLKELVDQQVDPRAEAEARAGGVIVIGSEDEEDAGMNHPDCPDTPENDPEYKPSSAESSESASDSDCSDAPMEQQQQQQSQQPVEGPLQERLLRSEGNKE